MCGVYGHFAGHCCALPPPASALRALAHRGPDGSAHVMLTPSSVLGFTWLQVVGAARQPFARQRGDTLYSLVCNGEIYNHESLWLMLRSGSADGDDSVGGSSCSDGDGASDCSVLLPCITAWGTERALARVSGMFALAVVATSPSDGSHVVHLARDRMGIKPLLWGTCPAGGCLAFASEVGAMPHGWPIRDVPPGRLLTLALPTGGGGGGGSGGGSGGSGGRPALVADVQFAPPWAPSPQSEPISTASLRGALVAAVASHLQGDHPVGVLLSGGLDSAVLAAVAARLCRQRGRPPPTAFTITHRGCAPPPPGAAPSDLHFAAATAAHLGLELSVAAFDTAAALAALPDAIRALESFDAALVRVGLPQLLLARHVAARGCRVVLSGEGADEVFAGYALFRGYDGSDGDGPTGLAAFERELARRLTAVSASELLRVDRCTAAAGVEARVPYLDAGFLAAAMHPSTAARKLSHPAAGVLEKALLRRAFAGWLPDAVLQRRKEGMADGVGAGWVAELQAAAVASEGVGDPARAEAALYARVFAQVAPGPARAELARTRIAARNAGRPVPLSALPDGTALLRGWRCVRDDPQLGGLFTAHEAAQFCARVLGVDVPPGARPSLPLLNDLIEGVLQRVPFHNFSLLTRPRVPPTVAELRADWLAAAGGTCASTSPAFAATLSALGFDVSLVAAVVRTEFDHLALLVLLGGVLHYVDIGNGKRYAEAAPLGGEGAGGPLGGAATLTWRVRWCAHAAAFHVTHGRPPPGGSDGAISWDAPPSVSFDPQRTVHYAFFHEHFARARRDAGYVFLRSLRLAAFPGLDSGVTARDAEVTVGGVRVATRAAGELVALVRPHVSAGVLEWLRDALAALAREGVDLWPSAGGRPLAEVTAQRGV